jgi:hypothetical protein
MDNFDEIVEEMGDGLSSELSQLAQRHGRDGLHFVLSGSMREGTSGFKRTVQATNYGIGLRNAESVEALRLARTPASLRSGKDLAVGRGYAVKSGVATMVQIASPYDGVPLPLRPEGEDPEDAEADRAWQALDYWVGLLVAQRGPYRPAWWGVAAAPTPVAGDAKPKDGPLELSPEVLAMLPLLRRALLWDARPRDEDADEDEDEGPVVAPLLARYSPKKWYEEGTLREVLESVFYACNKMTKEVYEAMTGEAPDAKSVLLGLDSMLPPLEGLDPEGELGDEAEDVEDANAEGGYEDEEAAEETPA